MKVLEENDPYAVKICDDLWVPWVVYEGYADPGEEPEIYVLRSNGWRLLFDNWKEFHKWEKERR